MGESWEIYKEAGSNRPTKDLIKKFWSGKSLDTKTVQKMQILASCSSKLNRDKCKGIKIRRLKIKIRANGRTKKQGREVEKVTNVHFSFTRILLIPNMSSYYLVESCAH